MKKIIGLSMVLSFIVLNLNAQKLKDSEVPATVKTSFDKIFPGQTAKWEKEDGNFEAGFKKEGKSMSATFQPDGTFKESEVGIKESELPAGALDYIKTNYNGKKVKESAKITSASKTVTYEAEIEGRDVIFDSSGKFLKEVKD
jgi:hypothetical protein